MAIVTYTFLNTNNYRNIKAKIDSAKLYSLENFSLKYQWPFSLAPDQFSLIQKK